MIAKTNTGGNATLEIKTCLNCRYWNQDNAYCQLPAVYNCKKLDEWDPIIQPLNKEGGDNMIKVGQVVKYRDENGKDHDALITAIHGTTGTDSVNLVYVSEDESRTDSYGQQMIRDCSVVHADFQNANGKFWFLPE